MTRYGNLIEIIHPGAAEMAVAHREACGLYNMRLDRKTRAESQNRPGILGNVRLIQGDPHGVIGLGKKGVKTAAMRRICASHEREPIPGLRSIIKGANRSILDHLFCPAEQDKWVLPPRGPRAPTDVSGAFVRAIHGFVGRLQFGKGLQT
ncbi:hypothetical protein GCM10022626_01990 [[Pseudomonas] carboxydohydrogena]